MIGKTLVKSITIDGTRYRIVKSNSADALYIEGPGIVGGTFLPGGLEVVNLSNFRRRVEEAIEEYRERHKETSEMIRERVRDGTAGLTNPPATTKPDKACAACSHPQAEWRPGEPSIMGSVKEAVCCTIHGRGTCGSPLHVHYCPVHGSAQKLLEALRGLMSRFEQTGEAWMSDPAMAAARAAIAEAEPRAAK